MECKRLHYFLHCGSAKDQHLMIAVSPVWYTYTYPTHENVERKVHKDKGKCVKSFLQQDFSFLFTQRTRFGDGASQADRSGELSMKSPLVY